MRCTFLANCGLLLEYEGKSVLVDAPNSLHSVFDGLPETEYKKMVAGVVPYDALCGLFFTHTHADHYDRERVSAITDERQDICAYAPGENIAREGAISVGPFTVRFFTIGHSGAEFADVVHRVLLVEAGGKGIYITGDAWWDSPAHLEIINVFKPAVAVWNPNFLSHEEGRALMEFVPMNYLYHLPVDADDVLGFGRKGRHDYARHKDYITIEMIDAYPTTVEI